MKKVVIGFDELGKPYVVTAPKKVIVEFREPKKKPLKKRIKTMMYNIKAGLF